MIVKKGFNYLINFNLKKGFFRLAILATPIWIISSWKMMLSIIWWEGYVPFNDEDIFGEHVAIGIFYTLFNPITFYYFVIWIIIPPIKWVLRGFSNND